MKTTRAMLVIGVLMLVLAVIVAQGLRPEETTTVSGPVVSGAVSKAPDNPAPTRAASNNAPAAPGSSGGVLVPLDAGTLKMDSTTPASRLAPVNLADAPKDPQKRGGENNSAPVSTSAPVAQPRTTAVDQKAPTPKDTPNVPEKLVVTTSAPQTLAAGQKAVSRTRLEIGPRTVTFRLTGVSTLKGKAFALKEPDRIVMDLDGSWGINLGKTPANALLKSVRAGAQDANTRLVFDLNKAQKSFKLIQVDPKTLELQIR